MAVKLDRAIANCGSDARVYFIQDPDDGHFIFLTEAEFSIFIETMMYEQQSS